METKLTDSHVHYDPQPTHQMPPRRLNTRWAIIVFAMFAALLAALVFGGVPAAWHWGG